MATERLAIKVDEKGALQVSRNIDDIGKSAKDTGGALKLLKRALGALAVAALTKQLISMADEFTIIQNKLKIVTDSTENLATVTDELFEIATRTRSSFEATASSYSKFALAAKELGRTQKEMLVFTAAPVRCVVMS
jgi:methyl-accepting chemotaxis protein